MDNVLYDVINSIFYETLEYIIAPLMLILLTHLLLSGNDRLKGFRHYSLEYNFVSLYSNLLFYFSLSAHRFDHIRTVDCLCGQVEAALLIACVFIFLIVLTHKHYESNASLPIRLQYIFDKTWLVVMLLLFLLIVVFNLHIHNCEIYITKVNTVNTLVCLRMFFTTPDHILLLIFMIFIIRLLVIAWRGSQYGDSAISFQGPTSPKTSPTASETATNQLKIAKNKNSKSEVRIQSFYHVADYCFENRDLYKALKYIDEAKVIAINIPYPEGLMLPIRKLKIKILSKQNKQSEATSEIQEVESKLSNANGMSKTILEYCVSELKKAFENNSSQKNE